MGKISPHRSRFRPWQRLRSPPEFRHVFRHGRARRDGLFTVIVAPSGQPAPRLGLAVSKKAARLANQRNRIKRVVRESFRTAAPGLPPVDIVVIARPGAANRSNGEIRSSITSHWKRLAKRCAKSPTA